MHLLKRNLKKYNVNYGLNNILSSHTKIMLLALKRAKEWMRNTFIRMSLVSLLLLLTILTLVTLAVLAPKELKNRGSVVLGIMN